MDNSLSSIQRLTLQLRLRNQTHHLEIEKQLQDLLRQYLGKILDEELMRANITDRIVLDSLELIIPPLREEAIAVDFTNHLRQKIRDAISEIASVEKRADVKPANENLFDAFSEFLLTGHFPWWYNRFHHGDHNALLRELLTRDAPKVLNIITGSSEKSASFFRFLKQFDVNLVAETFAQQGFAEMPTLIRAFDQYSRLLQTRFSAQQVQQLNFEVFRALFQHAGHSGWIAGTAKQPCIFFLEKATEVLKTDKTKIFLQLQGIPANDPFFAPMTNALSHRFEDIVRELLPETAGATIKSALLTDFRRNIILFLPPDVPQHIVNSIVADALTGLSGFSTSSDTLAEHVLLMIEKHSEKKAINLLLAAMPQFKRDKQKFVALVSKLMNELSAQELINLMHQHASSDFRHIPTQLSHILQAIGADESRNYLIILRKIARDILVEQTHFSPKKTKPQIFRNLVDFISKHIPVALDEIVAKLAEANTFAQLPDSLQKEITPLITPEQKQESLESDDLISSVPFHLRQAAYFMQHLSMSENLQQLSPDDLSAAILELATKFPAKAALLMHTHFSDSFRKSLVLATFPVGFFKQYFAATTPAIAAFAESLQLLFALHPQFSAMLPKLRNAGLIDIIEKLNFKKFRPGGTPQKLDEEFVAMLFREMTRDTVADIKNLIAGIIETQESKQLATLFQRILLAASDHQMYDSETKKDIPEPDTGQKSKQSESMKPEENISSEKSDVQTLPFTFDDLPKQMLADLMEYYFMHKSLPWWSTGLAQQLRKSGSIPLRLSIDDYLIITALKHATGWESEEKVQLISAFSTSAKAIKTIVHQFPESLVQGLMEFLYGVKYKQLIARIEEFVSDGKSRTFLPLIRAYTRFLMIAEYAQLHQFGDAQQLAFLMWQMQGFYPIPEFDDPELYAKHIEQKILEVDPSLTTEEAVKKTREARLATAAEKLPYFDISADETSLLSGRQFDDEDSAALRFLQLESLYPFVSAEKPSPFRLSEKRMFEYLEYYLKTSVLHPQIAFVSKNQFIEMIRQWLISPTRYALGFIAGIQRNKQSASRLVLLFGESVFNLLFSLEKPADIGLPPDAVETDQSLAPAAESHQAKLIRLLAEMVTTKGFSELLTEQQENLREYFQFLEGYIKTIRLGLEEPALKLPHNVIASEAKQSQFADIQEIASSFLASTSSAHLLAETMHFEPKKVSFPALLSLIQHDTDFFSESKQWIDGDIHDLIFSKSRGDSGTEDSATVSIDIADDTELQSEITTTDSETDQASIPADDNLFATRSTSVGVQLFSFYLQYGFLPWWSPCENFKAFEDTITGLIEKFGSIVRTELRLLLHDASVRKRIHFQFSDKLKLQLFELFLPRGESLYAAEFTLLLNLLSTLFKRPADKTTFELNCRDFLMLLLMKQQFTSASEVTASIFGYASEALSMTEEDLRLQILLQLHQQTEHAQGFDDLERTLLLLMSESNQEETKSLKSDIETVYVLTLLADTIFAAEKARFDLSRLQGRAKKAEIMPALLIKSFSTSGTDSIGTAFRFLAAHYGVSEEILKEKLLVLTQVLGASNDLQSVVIQSEAENQFNIQTQLAHEEQRKLVTRLQTAETERRVWHKLRQNLTLEPKIKHTQETAYREHIEALKAPYAEKAGQQLAQLTGTISDDEFLTLVADETDRLFAETYDEFALERIRDDIRNEVRLRLSTEAEEDARKQVISELEEENWMEKAQTSPAVSSRADEVTPQQQVSGQGLSDNVDDENTYKAPSLQGDVLSLSKQGTTKQSRKKNRTDEKSGTSFDKQLKARISKISTLISQDKLSEVIANAGLSTTTSVASDVPFSKETREPADFLRQLLDEAATFLESTQPHDIAESTILQITTAFGVETAAGILLQILAAKQGMVLAQILPGFLKHISSIPADGHPSAVALKSFLEKEKLFGLKQVDAAFDLPDSRESVSETASIITEQGQQPISLSDDKEFTVAENSAFGAISQWLYGDAFGQEKEDILFQHTKIAEFTGFLLQGDQLGLQQSEMEAIQQEIRTAYHDFLTETKSSQTGLPPDVADIDITKPEHLRISRIWTAMLLGLIQHIVPEPETTVQRQQPLPAHFFHGMTFPDALIALIAATSLTQSYSPLLLVNKMNDMANAEFLLPVAHFLQQQFGAKKGIKPLLSNHLLRSYLENGLVAAGETRISVMEETEITPLSMKDYADELVDFVHAGDQEEAYRKLIDEKHDWTKQKTQDKKIYIENAGLAIIWLYLPSLFKKLNLVDAKGFVSEEARERAVLLLQYIVTGEEEAPEYLLMLNKIMCGMMILQPVRQNVQLSDEEKEEAIVLIKSVVKNWPILGNTSVEGFRNTFLKREGTLFLKEGNWNLKVESKTLDILMRKMPWGIGTIKLSWNKYIIFVEWNY